MDEGIGEQRARWEKGTRFYEALVECDLFGDWVLTLVWGRRGSLGRVHHRSHPPASAARKAVETVARRRARRGYARIR